MTLVNLPRFSKQKCRIMLSSIQRADMRDWGSDFGKCLKQKSVRQETTKFKTGTLSLILYTTNDIVQKISVSFQHGDMLEFKKINSSDKDEEVQQSEYESFESDSDNKIEQENHTDYQCIDMKNSPECLIFM